MKVTLTFDNGPEPGATDRVLEVLKSEGIAATFFVLGTKLADPARRALTVRAHAEGHWIGNHTMTHGTPLGRLQEPGAARREILEAQALLGDLAHPDRLFRPFGGGGALGPHLLNAEALEVLKEERMTCVLWNAIPRDWLDPDGWVDRALDQVKERDWTLMVLHDIASGAMRQLDRFLDRIGEAGGRLRQDFPPDCVPMVEGMVSSDFDRYVSR